MKFKRMLAGLLAVACTTSLLAGCGSTDDNKPSSSESKSEVSKSEVSKSDSSSAVADDKVTVTYPLEEEVTLTIAMIEEGQYGAQNFKDISETPFFEEWEKATGVNIVVDQYTDSTAMNLMFAGGELPDIIYFNFASYNGGITKALKDKIIEPLNDYMEYAPDLQALFDSNDVYRKSATTSDGSILGFPFVRGDKRMLNSLGFIVRQDYLDKVGEELPVTVDDFYRVLTKFRDELDLASPFSLMPSYLSTFGLGAGILTSPFDLPKCDFYVEDGKVHYGFYEKELKDVLTFLHKLYDEDLLDKNFATVDTATARANMMNGVSGITIDLAGGGMGTAFTAMQDDPEFDLSGFSSLVAKEGDVAMSCHYDNPVTSYYTVITPQCKNKEAAVAFLNYGYTQAGHDLMNYGIEGVNYTKGENGEVVYNTELESYSVPYHRGWSGFPFVQEAQIDTLLDQQKQAKAAWVVSDVEKYQLPALAIPEEYSSEYSKIMGDVGTFTFEMTVKFINGEVDIDNFETAYLAELKKMGVERAIEIIQIALDEYNSR